MPVKYTQLGRRGSGKLALQIGAAVSEAAKFCSEIHGFKNYFNVLFTRIKTGNHTYPDNFYKLEDAGEGAYHLWKLNAKGDKERVVYRVYN